MIVNFNKKYTFPTRLQLKGENLQVVQKVKILGTILTNPLSWDENCSLLEMDMEKNTKFLQSRPKDIESLLL